MKDDITGLILCGFIFFLLLTMSMILRSGRGSSLISGYNMLSKEEKAKYNEKALCHYIGNMLLTIDVLLVPAVIAGLYDITWISLVVFTMITVITVGGIIYVNTNSKFKK